MEILIGLALLPFAIYGFGLLVVATGAIIAGIASMFRG